MKIHKGALRGSCRITLSKQQFELVSLYVDVIRPMIKPVDGMEEFLFLTRSGHRHDSVSSHIRFVWNSYGYPGYFTLTNARKILETESFGRLDVESQTHLSTQLNHTPSVAKRHYTAHTAEAAIRGKAVIDRLIGKQE